MDKSKCGLVGAFASLFIILTLTGCKGSSAPGDTATVADPIARGAYLVAVGGCNDCHTPLTMGEDDQPAPDMSRMLSGHPEALEMPPAPAPMGPWLWSGAATNTAFAGPWGVSFAINLTPDEATGIGVWTEDVFVQAMRTGRHWGQSRPILPPMPWQNVAKMTDEDLTAVFAYLKSIPPITNHVPDAILAPPPADGEPPAPPAGE